MDAHLAQYQTIADAFRGHGTLKAKLNINGHELAANLQWGDRRSDFRVVDKATDPAASEGSKSQFADGKVSQVDFTLYFNYITNNFQTAVLRAAYLILFKCFGYEYVQHDIVQVIRRRIADPSLGHPRLASLIFEARNLTPPYDSQHDVVPV